MKKKFMIRCDIEGVTGVVSYEQAEPGKAEYVFGQKMFMSDLLALLKGLRDGGADEVVIYDEHYYGRNIDLGELPRFASAICGKPPYRPDWAGGLDDSFAGLILLGFHAKADTPGGLLPHSYELDIRNLLLNDVSVGEIGMEAAIAGDFYVPTLLIVGDSAGVAEAQVLMPGIAAVTVKQAACESGALCHGADQTAEWIRKAAAKVAKSPPAVTPYHVGTDVILRVELRDGHYLTAVRKICKRDLCDERTLRLTGKSATEVWAKYWNKKLRCQREMAK